uniref:CHCH domain-containing protein n=1 Tax=Oryza nivara TaxID=4536 RepID=A0A0E0G5H8_ORYNI
MHISNFASAVLKKKKEIKGEYLRVSSPPLRVKENLPSRLLRYLRHPRLNRGEAPISIWRAEQGRGGDPGGAFGGNRGVRPVPPEKGVFPLDHLHECDLEKKDYLACLKSTGFQSEKCRQFSKKYLECRMERNLMAKQDMSELGFRSEDVMNPSPNKKNNLESSASGPNEER